jgi:TonB-linked SusC/RagA family outer membrane protein
MTKFYLSVSRYLVVLLLLCNTVAWAQSRTVSGKVTSGDDGSTIPGVNVIEKGTSNGTVTDVDGNYSLTVTSGESILVFSFVGFTSQEAAVGAQTSISVTLQPDVTALSEVVVVGYGTQEKKEITSAVVQVTTSEFNRGNVNDPTQLLQGKVAGLSIYNRGGNPNQSATIRLRGISTIGANTSPLIVVDGVIGASLDNIDPNDIESFNVLKDGSAAAIYGSRGSSGVILVTTKRGSKKGTTVDYNGYIAAATIYRRQPVFSASEYVANGGNDLGSQTDWQDEVTRTGFTNVHNLSIGGGNETTQFRLAANFRDVNGILKESGFDQSNFRANMNHKALSNKLRFDFNMALTSRKSNFSFNEALRYAVLYNPTAPIRFDNGNYYQAILFDNFNPVAILEQNVNEGKRKNINYNARVDYDLFKNFTVTANYAQQFETNLNGEYYSRNSLFRGLNRGGLARRFTNESEFTLFEMYGTYSTTLGKVGIDANLGYSYQEDEYQDIFIELGNFPNDELGYHALENAGDRLSGLASLVNISSARSPNNKIIAQFARVALTFGTGISFNASVRREGSSKLGENNQWGIFPAAGLGIDISKYLTINNVDLLKLRIGYGVTGSLPAESGLAQALYDYSFNGGGSKTLNRLPNPDLKWETKSETNIGIDLSLGGKFTATVDAYTRDISDFVSVQRTQAGQSSALNFTGNSGRLVTRGIEIALSYKSFNFGALSWTPGLNLTSYESILKELTAGGQTSVRGSLGAPGQNDTNMIRLSVDSPIGEIWGPVFAGVNEADGKPIFADLNGDGVIKALPGNALAEDGDFATLGKGIPSWELGWSNQLTYKNWDLNAFFRGAFGHSLINNFRAFYEPIDPGAINSYNRITTDKAVAGLTTATYSSLYVEKADFFKLDNLSLGYNFKVGDGVLRSMRLYVTGQNLFVITNYTGIDPEPVIADPGPSDNGGFQPTAPDVLAPGIDRRNSYFTQRTFTFGVQIGL